MTLPTVIPFERLPGEKTARECFYRVVATRRPKKGEWYISGTVPMAYRATHDLTVIRVIVVPIFYAKKSNDWVQGQRVIL